MADDLELERRIEEAFELGTPIDEAMNKAVREAVLLHKRMGQPLAVWRDGRTVWLSADEVEEELRRESQQATN